MKKIFLFVVLVLVVFILGDSCSQEIYTFDWNSPRQNINGHPHFKVNYFPGTTNSNYKGDFYPDLESNTIIKKYTFSSNYTLTASTDFRTAGIFTTPMNTVDNPFGSITDMNSVLIIPYGVTVTFSGRPDLIPTLLIKGRVVLNPNVGNTGYWVSKTILFPTGVLESIPTTASNHTLYLQGPWVTLKGLNSESMWTGFNSSYSSYGGSFL
ncbi:hypothetical protein ACTFIW_009658 [Dictyostelium discoideum]